MDTVHCEKLCDMPHLAYAATPPVVANISLNCSKTRSKPI